MYGKIFSIWVCSFRLLCCGIRRLVLLLVVMFKLSLTCGCHGARETTKRYTTTGRDLFRIQNTNCKLICWKFNRKLISYTTRSRHIFQFLLFYSLGLVPQILLCFFFQHVKVKIGRTDLLSAQIQTCFNNTSHNFLT